MWDRNVQVRTDHLAVHALDSIPIAANPYNLLYLDIRSSTNGMTTDSRLAEDLNVDSLESVEIIMHLEEEFDLEIYDEDSKSINTLGDLYKFVHLKAGKSPTSESNNP